MLSVTNPRLKYLFQRYFEASLSNEEKEEFFDIINQAQYDEELKRLMSEVWTQLSPFYRLTDEQSKRILSGILPSLFQRRRILRRKKTRMLKWSAIAASLLILLSGGWMWYRNNAKKKSAVASVEMETQYNNGVLPVANKTLLILGNGKSVVLDSVGNGIIAKQGGIPVIKLNGQLSYSGQTEESTVTLYNTILTPRGKQYRVILPDGSQVWLNAASSLRFPTRFINGIRSVELTGEAYFEIADYQDEPFVVKTNGMQVDVLGTRFNIMAYKSDADVKTTLVQGSVRVSKGNEKVILKPNEEASLENSGNNSIQVKKADIQAALAWKNGLFLFHNADIKSVLREIVRWYDVDIIYEGGVNAHLNGMISRKASLSEVLNMIEITSNIKFKVEGKKVMVMSTVEN